MEEQPMDQQFLDFQTKKFTWKIPGFSNIVETKLYSYTFTIDGGNWRIMMYPKGNQTDHLSLYLDVPGAATMPHGWNQTACFSFILVNQLTRGNSKIFGAQIDYNAESAYWGFQEFIPLSDLQDPNNGFLLNDTLILEVQFEPKLTGETVVTSTKFSWKITNFPSLTEKYYYSPMFKIGGGNWKLLIFPTHHGSQQTRLWVFLEVANQASLPKGWNLNAELKLIIVNQKDYSKSIVEDIRNEFKCGQLRRGYPSPVELRGGNDEFIVNDTLVIEADFVPEEVKPTGEELLDGKKFTWKITNFTQLGAKKYYSNIFTVDGKSWRIAMYPKGRETNNLSIYLNVPDSEMLPAGWKQSAHFSFIIVNQNGGQDYEKEGEGRPVQFSAGKIDRGHIGFLSLGKLHEPSNGYLVNDTLIVQVNFETELQEEHTVTTKKFTWKIRNFLSLTAKSYTSQTDEIDGIKWRLQIYPKGRGSARTHLSLYLHVMNSEALPEGWTIYATYKLIVVNQNNHLRSTIKDEEIKFCQGISSWGEQSMISLSELHDSTHGFIMNNTLIVEADFVSLQITPTNAPLHFHFSSMKKFISDADSGSTLRSHSYSQNELVVYTNPSTEDIVKAKESLKGCLSDLFKLNMKERLEEALLILSKAESGLSADQKTSIRTFRDGFDEFTSDFLVFEQANSEFELQKVQKDKALRDLKRTQENYLSINTMMDKLVERKDRVERQLEEIKSEKEGIMLEWEKLVVESQVAKYEYEIQEKKAAEVVEQKRISEQKMSRLSTFWSNMKAQFT